MAGSSNDDAMAVSEPLAPPPPAGRPSGLLALRTWPAAETTWATPSRFAVDPDWLRLSPYSGIAKNVQLILRHQYTEGYVRVPDLHLKYKCLQQDSYETVVNTLKASRHQGKARFLWAYIDDVFCIEVAPRLQKPTPWV